MEITEEDQIEMTYTVLHCLIEGEWFDAVDSVLGRLKIGPIETSVLLAILTATAMLEVRKKLSYRSQFYRRCIEMLQDRVGSEEAEELLAGLE